MRLPRTAALVEKPEGLEEGLPVPVLLWYWECAAVDDGRGVQLGVNLAFLGFIECLLFRLHLNLPTFYLLLLLPAWINLSYSSRSASCSESKLIPVCTQTA